MKNLAKRAQIIYETFQTEISQMDFSKKGKERVKEFLRAIEFENASEVMKNSLLVIEEQKLNVVKVANVFHALEKKGINCDWHEYYRQLQNDFRRWSHCDKIREVAGKSTGATDLFRLYDYLWGSRN